MKLLQEDSVIADINVGQRCSGKVRNNSLFPRPEHEGVQKTKGVQTEPKFPPLFYLSLPDSIMTAVSLLSV